MLWVLAFASFFLLPLVVLASLRLLEVWFFLRVLFLCSEGCVLLLAFVAVVRFLLFTCLPVRNWAGFFALALRVLMLRVLLAWCLSAALRAREGLGFFCGVVARFVLCAIGVSPGRGRSSAWVVKGLSRASEIRAVKKVRGSMEMVIFE